MSGMLEWAKEEVKLACKKENPDMEYDENGNPIEFDYGISCYYSALRAYESLLKDNHTGMSINITKSILNRLIDHQPLTPIEDTEDVWNYAFYKDTNGAKVYQCKRMSSLFKDVLLDGKIEYSNNDTCYCVNINEPNISYRSGLVNRIIEEMYPITMPYWPTKPIKVFTENFLVDPKNGDFDTFGIFYLIKDDEKVEVNRFFKASENGWDEINIDEYNERKEFRIKHDTDESV